VTSDRSEILSFVGASEGRRRLVWFGSVLNLPSWFGLVTVGVAFRVGVVRMGC